MTYEFRASCLLPVPFSDFAVLFRAEADEHDLALTSTPDGPVVLVAGEGAMIARPEGSGTMLAVEAATRDWLFTLQESAAEHFAEVDTDTPLLWVGDTAASDTGGLPPNVSLGTVVSVRRLSDSFLRMRVSGGDLARLERDMIHLRLILPQTDGLAPRWPHLTAAGRASWPDDLHTPVYTVAAIDAAAGWVDLDIFVHEGGRTCAFALGATGTTVGLAGPGGGGIPIAARLMLAGDETAYPALARIAAAQAPGSRIDLTLLGRTADYPIAPKRGLTITHRSFGEAELATELTSRERADFYWIATERTRLSRLKDAVLKDLGVPKTACHLAAYWSADDR